MDQNGLREKMKFGFILSCTLLVGACQEQVKVKTEYLESSDFVELETERLADAAILQEVGDSDIKVVLKGMLDGTYLLEIAIDEQLSQIEDTEIEINFLTSSKSKRFRLGEQSSLASLLIEGVNPGEHVNISVESEVGNVRLNKIVELSKILYLTGTYSLEKPLTLRTNKLVLDGVLIETNSKPLKIETNKLYSRGSRIDSLEGPVIIEVDGAVKGDLKFSQSIRTGRGSLFLRFEAIRFESGTSLNVEHDSDFSKSKSSVCFSEQTKSGFQGSCTISINK